MLRQTLHQLQRTAAGAAASGRFNDTVLESLLAAGSRSLVSTAESGFKFSAPARGFSSTAGDPEGPPAFVFDIDGVLIRGGTVLPASRRALAKLYQPGGEKPRYPVCFLTNGGGVTEAAKAEELSNWLDVQVHERQVVLAHTPFRQLHHLFDKPVLVAGVGEPDVVALHYGFQQVLTVPQLHAAHPHAAPFAAHTAVDVAAAPGDTGTEAKPIAAVLVFKDPPDWYRDTQLILDVLTSGGVPGRDAPLEGAPPVELYISNPDMLWANEYPTSRLGQGAFAAILKVLHREVTGQDLPHMKYFGKPNREAYRLIESLLLEQIGQLPTAPPDLESPVPSQPLPFSSVFAIGDNPASDIAGANAAGPPWVSCLVRTGVFRGPLGANSADHPAQLVVDDVEAAVEAALHRTRHRKWHSMR